MLRPRGGVISTLAAPARSPAAPTETGRARMSRPLSGNRGNPRGMRPSRNASLLRSRTEAKLRADPGRSGDLDDALHRFAGAFAASRWRLSVGPYRTRGTITGAPA